MIDPKRLADLFFCSLFLVSVSITPVFLSKKVIADIKCPVKTPWGSTEELCPHVHPSDVLKPSSESEVGCPHCNTPQSLSVIPLKLYWSSQRADNFVTATLQGKNDAMTAGYGYVRIEACIFPTQKTGTVPLNLYWSAERGDNFTTTTNPGANDAMAAGYVFARTEGYIYSKQQTGTVPLNLYWSAERGDNFTTATNQGANDAMAAGYVFARTEGYVDPANRCQQSKD